jgi:hypothetical protein
MTGIPRDPWSPTDIGITSAFRRENPDESGFTVIRASSLRSGERVVVARGGPRVYVSGPAPFGASLLRGPAAFVYATLPPPLESGLVSPAAVFPLPVAPFPQARRPSKPSPHAQPGPSPGDPVRCPLVVLPTSRPSSMRESVAAVGVTRPWLVASLGLSASRGRSTGSPRSSASWPPWVRGLRRDRRRRGEACRLKERSAALGKVRS